MIPCLLSGHNHQVILERIEARENLNHDEYVEEEYYYSDARPPSATCLDAYPGTPPEMVLVDITDDVVSAVAGRLSGGAGPGETDLISLQHWLLWFGAASGALRLIVAEMEEWLSNGRPHWAAYRALMSGRLIALDNSP